MIISARYVASAAVILTALACSASEMPGIDRTAQLCAQRQSIVAQFPTPTLDDDFEILARLLPGGFGGLTSEFIFLKTPALADSVRATAQLLATCPGDQLGALWTIVEHAPVHSGQYDWVELRTWYTSVLADPSSTGALVTSDMDEATNRLAFAFASQGALDAFRARAQTIGVPAGALELTIRASAMNSALTSDVDR